MQQAGSPAATLVIETRLKPIKRPTYEKGGANIIRIRICHKDTRTLRAGLGACHPETGTQIPNIKAAQPL